MELMRHLISDPDWWLKRLLASILLILGYWLINRVLGNAITSFNGLLKKHRPISRSISSSYAAIFRRVMRWALGLLLLVLILRVWGADVSVVWTTFVGMLAVIGVGLLATWTMASNVTARFFIWFWQPVRLGQRIEIFPENLCGRVTEENLMFTELRQDDGHVIVIPNNLLFQRVIRRAPENGPGDKKE
jgi:small-conductance mechanosensitive channel